MKTPRPFQAYAVTKMSHPDSVGFLLGDECGLGKTVTAIEAAKKSRSTGPWLGMVVCPKSLIDQWIDALKDQDPDAFVIASNYIPWSYRSLNPEGPAWVIVTYPELHNNTIRGTLGKIVWDVIIADEAHRIKNRIIKVSRHLKTLSKARAFALTGTPMETTIADMWSIMNFVRPDKFDNYHRFVAMWVDKKKGYQNHMVLGGPKNPLAFGIMMSEFMLRRTKLQVAPELPPKIIIHEKVPMEEAQRDAYDVLSGSKDIQVTVAETEFFVANVLSLITKVQQLSSYPHLLGFDKMPSGKCKWLDEFLEDHEGETIIVFTRFRNLALVLAKQYGGAHIVGGDDQSKDFIHGNNNLLFGTIDSMGEGFNLQKAKYAVFMDGHWSARQMTQAMDRLHRIDDLEPKVIYLLESCKEDRLIYKAVEEKWSDADFVFHYLNDDEEF